MDSALLFFFIGLGVFGVKLVVANWTASRRLWAFIAAGTLSGALVAWLGGHPLSPIVEAPAWLILPVGALTGGLCHLAESQKLLEAPGVKYLATALLGAIVAVTAWGLTFVYMAWVDVPIHGYLTGGQQAIIYGAVGFASVLGYTFPARWFKQRGLDER